MDMMIESSLGLEVLNMILLSILIFFYVNNLVKFKSGITYGLLVFAIFLLVQNVMGLFFGLSSLQSMSESFENYIFFMNFMETIALLALFWVTWK
jgi:uncharacterized membrane protein